MINIKTLKGNAIEVTMPEVLKTEDFRQITPPVDGLIAQHGKIRLLLDASSFTGWENMSAFENHMSFVKSHQQKIERAAFLAGHAWQHWLVGAIRLFVHPEIRIYDKSQENEAMQWITG